MFDVFDEDCDGLLEQKHFATALRATGLIISEKEVSEILSKVDPDKSGFIEMGDFYIQVARKFRDKGEIEKSIKDALHNLSFFNENENIQSVNVQSLKSALANEEGEPLLPSEIGFFIQSIPKDYYISSGKDGDTDYYSLENFILMNENKRLQSNGNTTHRSSEAGASVNS